MLKQIIENKRKEVELAKKSMPLNTFKSKIQKSTRNFKEALSQNKLNLIAEFKRNSPSGNINKKQFNMSANRNAISEHAQKSPIFDKAKEVIGKNQDVLNALEELDRTGKLKKIAYKTNSMIMRKQI